MWNYRSPYLQYHLSNAGHLGWLYQVTFTALKYHSFDAPWSLGRKSVFCTILRVLHRVHDARSSFYTWVHILYPARNALVRVLYLSACFVLFSTFPAMQYQICFFHTFSHLRNLKVQRRVTVPQGQQHVSSVQQSEALFGEVSHWLGDQTRIPCVAITFFPFLFQGYINDCRTAILV